MTGCQEIKPVSPKGSQSWIFIERTDAEGETPILWPPDMKNCLIWKDPDAGKRWKAGREGSDRGWDGWLSSPTRWTWAWLGSRSWWRTGKPGMLHAVHGVAEWDTTEWLNWIELNNPSEITDWSKRITKTKPRPWDKCYNKEKMASRLVARFAKWITGV